MLNFDLMVTKLKEQGGTQEEIEIINAIEESLEELKEAQMVFNNQEEDGLVEYAIYRECAAKAKYNHFLSKLKKLQKENTNTNQAI